MPRDTILNSCSSLCQKDGGIRGGMEKIQGCRDQLPERGDVLAPWVALEFVVGEQIITVSNESSPDSGNAAVIKSFEYGTSDGFTAKFVIEDQEGGSFINVVKHMFKDWKKAKEIFGASEYQIKFRFGWAKSSCGVPVDDAVSTCIWAWVTSMETNFTGGKYTIEFTATDLCKKMTEGGEERAQGSDDQKMCLKDAIIQLLTNTNSPNVQIVEFRKMEAGTPKYCGFLIKDPACEFREPPKNSPKPDWFKQDTTNRGPKGTWRPEGEDKLTAVRRWLSPFLTEDSTGWSVTTVGTEKGGKVIIWADRTLPCKNTSATWWQSNCIGHYIINGSKYSPVIEFNPKFQWTFDHLINHGGIASGSSGHVAAGDPKDPSKPTITCEELSRNVQRSAGHADTHVEMSLMRDIFGQQAAQKTVEAHEGSARADARWFPSILEAQLVIIGDPCVCRPDEMMSKTVTLTMFNPFFIRNEGLRKEPLGGKNKYEWYAIPPKNCVITNTAWQVQGITHKIELGKFTTTLHLFIAAPGVDGAPCENLGLVEDDGVWNPCFGC